MAFAETMTFDFEINTSLQVGDQVYYTQTTSSGGFNQNNSVFGGQVHLGEVTEIISPSQIMVFFPYGYISNFNSILGEYISFSKSRIVNNSDLLGYWAEVEFTNNSSSLAKLWAVGSEITENSK